MGQSSNRSRNTTQTASCKIDRVSAAYDIPEEAEQLGEYWTRDHDRYSLRELAVHLNHRLLRSAMDHAGLNPLDGEVENTYRLLTDEEVSQGMQTQARNHLEKHDIDVEQLDSDFVSYQTVNRHLKRCLEVERKTTDTDTDPTQTATQNIAALQNRTVAVTENTLSRLNTAGDLVAGDIDVFVDITVSCSDCGMHATVREFIANDGCSCEDSTSA